MKIEKKNQTCETYDFRFRVWIKLRTPPCGFVKRQIIRLRRSAERRRVCAGTPVRVIIHQRSRKLTLSVSRSRHPPMLPPPPATSPPIRANNTFRPQCDRTGYGFKLFGKRIIAKKETNYNREDYPGKHASGVLVIYLYGFNGTP